MTPLDRLRRDLDLAWVRDDAGRLVRANTPEHRPAPALVVATTVDGTGRVWAASTEVPDDVVAPIDEVLRDEAARATPVPPSTLASTDVPGWAPSSADRLLSLLGEHGPIEVGTAYVLTESPSARPVPAGAVLRTSAEPGAEEVRALVPEPDRALAAPWAIALVDGEVASVCESARLRSTAAAAGVWTYEPHRGHGLASAVVAAWAGLVVGTPHYGHVLANLASARVARRVGFRPIGSWWWVRPSAP